MKIHGKHICFLFVLGILPATIIMIGIQTLFNFNILYAQNNNISKVSDKSLEKVWESPNQLKNPESVVYDSKKNMLTYLMSMEIQMTKITKGLSQ